MYYDLEHDSYVENKLNTSQKILHTTQKFLYNTILGRCLLKVVATRFASNIYAKYMNSKLSKHKIKGFIKSNNIKMSDYEEKDYKSFNDFFIRQLKPNARQIEDNVIAVCDSKLSIYEINDNSSFNIKNSTYTIEELIGENRKYKYALIFRLCVDNYHHYVFPDDGNFVSTRHIDGILHTVDPIALKKYKVFHENSRDITFLDCAHLGDVCYIEVGALNVGKIINENKSSFKKGEEKGHFEFGGSTVIMLLNKSFNLNEKIIENSKKGIETIVKMGQCIGK